MTRVSFTRGVRAVSKWTLELRVPGVEAVRSNPSRAATSVVRLTHLGTRKTYTYSVKSAYVSSSMAVYLAREGTTSLTVVFPMLPRTPGASGGSAKTKAVVLFDNDPVSTFVEGTWRVQAIPKTR